MVLLIVATALLTACGEGSAAGGVNLAPDQTVHIPVPHDPGNLDPALVDGEEEADIDANVFGTLVRADNPTGFPQPSLASDLPAVSADRRTYTFDLRPRARFGNGDPLTSADVIYSWSRAAALQGPEASVFAGVEGYVATVASGGGAQLSGLVAVDDHTLQVKLNRPQSYFLDRLAAPVAAVVDQKVIASAGDLLGRGLNRSWATQPATLVGSGPYRMTARAPGRSLEFAPVADWWGSSKPIVRSVHLDVVGDVAGVAPSFLTGGYDLIGYAGFARTPADLLSRLRRAAPATLITVPRAASTWVVFNQRQGPFGGGGKAAMLRQAFILAIDRDRLRSDLCHNSDVCVAATGGLVPPRLPGYAGDGRDKLAVSDSVRAEGLLHQADPDGSATRGMLVDFADTAENVALFQFLQDQWQRSLGVRVERFVHGAQAVQPPPAVLIQRWQVRFGDPQELLAGYFGTGGANNLGGFSDSRVDSLIAQAQDQSPADSLTSYAMALQQLQADGAYVPLYYDTGHLAVNAHIRGATLGAMFDGPWGRLAVLQP